jgi:hypothetical protein
MIVQRSQKVLLFVLEFCIIEFIPRTLRIIDDHENIETERIYF